MKYNVDNTYYVIAEFITIVTEYKSNAQIYFTQNLTINTICPKCWGKAILIAV